MPHLTSQILPEILLKGRSNVERACQTVTLSISMDLMETLANKDLCQVPSTLL